MTADQAHFLTLNADLAGIWPPIGASRPPAPLSPLPAAWSDQHRGDFLVDFDDRLAEEVLDQGKDRPAMPL